MDNDQDSGQEEYVQTQELHERALWELQAAYDNALKTCGMQATEETISRVRRADMQGGMLAIWARPASKLN